MSLLPRTFRPRRALLYLHFGLLRKPFVSCAYCNYLKPSLLAAFVWRYSSVSPSRVRLMVQFRSRLRLEQKVEEDGLPSLTLAHQCSSLPRLTVGRSVGYLEMPIRAAAANNHQLAMV